MNTCRRRLAPTVLKTILAPLGAGIALSMLSSCFTGVESTPRIDDSELRRAKAAKLTPEELFLQSVVPSRAADWTPGKQLIVADSKIRLVLTVPEGAATVELAPGDVLTFKAFEGAASLTGEDACDVLFSAQGYPEVRYRLNISPEALMKDDAPIPEVPFTVDPLLAAKADSIVASRPGPLYVLSPLWYDATTEKAVGGYRLIAVEPDSVRPGNHIFPLKLYFHVADTDLASTEVGRGEKMVFMAHGGKSRGSTRTFPSLFAFDEQRRLHPSITDDTWALIINSRVCEGMTKDECRLALGSPAAVDLTPTRTGDYERWGYSDGVYLIFNPEGLLVRYRL